MKLVSRLIAEREQLSQTLDEARRAAEEQIFIKNHAGAIERSAAGQEATRLKHAVRAIEDQLKQVDAATSLLGPVVPSINQRVKNVHYHYDNWLEVKERGIYAAKLSSRAGGDGYINATKYNAEVAAFLQNVHALCDSLPYILNLYFRIFDLDSRSIGWSERCIDLLADAARSRGEMLLADQLIVFAAHPKFLKLQDIVNCSKHKHLVSIFYKGDSTFFAELSDGWQASDTDVHEFMLAVDDQLLPLFLKMIELASHQPSDSEAAHQ